MSSPTRRNGHGPQKAQRCYRALSAEPDAGPEVAARQPSASSVLGFPESCWKQSFVTNVARCYIHYRGTHKFTSLGCSLQGNNPIFPQPCALLSLQHAGKAEQAQLQSYCCQEPPLPGHSDSSCKVRRSPLCRGCPQHYRAPAGFGWLLAASTLLRR